MDSSKDFTTDAQGKFSCYAGLKYFYDKRSWIVVLAKIENRVIKNVFELSLKPGENKSSKEVKLKDNTILRINFSVEKEY